MNLYIHIYFSLRDPKQCPECSYCGTSLPRHLQNVHKWPKIRASAAVSFLGLRKKYERNLPYSPKKLTPKKPECPRTRKNQTCTRKAELPPL